MSMATNQLGIRVSSILKRKIQEKNMIVKIAKTI